MTDSRPLTILAAVPILTILVLLLGLGWSVIRAGAVGLSAALLLAWFVFGFGEQVYGDVGVAGATGGNMIAPHNMIAGGTTVGLQGEEGAVLRYTLLACSLYALLGGLVVLAITLVRGIVRSPALFSLRPAHRASGALKNPPLVLHRQP